MLNKTTDCSAEALSENSSSLSSDSPSIEPFFQTTELDYFRKILISRRDNLLKKRGDCRGAIEIRGKTSPLDNLDDKNNHRRLLDMRRAKDRLGRMLSEGSNSTGTDEEWHLWDLCRNRKPRSL